MPLEKNLRDRITLEERMALIEVRHLFNKAQQAWNRIESGKQCELNAMHHEESSLAHCLRWGTQAAEDLIELTKGAQASQPRLDSWPEWARGIVLVTTYP